MRANAPIGILDSGVGGYTVARVLQKRLPKEDIIYYGDGGNAPYGNRTAEDIVHIVGQILDFMAEQGVKAVGLACNTSSALIDRFADNYDFPIFSIVQAGADEVLRRGMRQVGVLSTVLTAKTGSYPRLIQAGDPAVEVFSQGSVNLAALVESGTASEEEIVAELRASLGQLVTEQPELDTLVLGCTHYPIVQDIIARTYPQFTNIIDPALGQVENMKACFAGNNALNPGGGKLQLYTSGDCGKFEAMARQLGLKLSGPAIYKKVAHPL
ncbi:MAG: glutamate racemase [Ruminococcaceae bacterium]|nr:glutamate racemase [Oscillospiraceae bacterium]